MPETLRAAPPSDSEARKHRDTLRNAPVADSMGTMIDLDGGSTR
jgi:hypothetical protein